MNPLRRHKHAILLAALIVVALVESFSHRQVLGPGLSDLVIVTILLLVFLIYFGLHYQELRGMDCSCFPWLKRVVGPGFFIGDGAMLYSFTGGSSPSIAAGLALAYVATLIANTTRICIALEIQRRSFEVDGLSGNQLHRLEGILVYFGLVALLVLVGVALAPALTRP